MVIQWNGIRQARKLLYVLKLKVLAGYIADKIIQPGVTEV